MKVEKNNLKSVLIDFLRFGIWQIQNDKCTYEHDIPPFLALDARFAKRNNISIFALVLLMSLAEMAGLFIPGSDAFHSHFSTKIAVVVT